MTADQTKEEMSDRPDGGAFNERNERGRVTHGPRQPNCSIWSKNEWEVLYVSVVTKVYLVTQFRAVIDTFAQDGCELADAGRTKQENRITHVSVSDIFIESIHSSPSLSLSLSLSLLSLHPLSLSLSLF